MWTSLAPRVDGVGEDALTRRTIGALDVGHAGQLAVSPARVTAGRAARGRGPRPAPAGRVHAGDQVDDLALGGDPDVELLDPGDQPDVVERDDVGRVGERDDEPVARGRSRRPDALRRRRRGSSRSSRGPGGSSERSISGSPRRSATAAATSRSVAMPRSTRTCPSRRRPAGAVDWASRAACSSGGLTSPRPTRTSPRRRRSSLCRRRGLSTRRVVGLSTGAGSGPGSSSPCLGQRLRWVETHL